LARNLEGTERAKERLEIILETIAGELSIEEACEELGISDARFFQMRTRALAAALADLESRPAGRPSQSDSPEQQIIAELQQKVQEKESQLKATQVRLEVAQTLPKLVQEEGAKKKTPRKKQRRMPAARRKRRRGK
jgi:hypothetical protein